MCQALSGHSLVFAKFISKIPPSHSLSLSLSLDIDRDGREGDKVFKNIQLLPNNSLSYLDNKI